MVDTDVLVCPRCGNPPGEHPFCSECGLQLPPASERPTRAGWMQANLPPPPGTAAAPPPAATTPPPPPAVTAAPAPEGAPGVAALPPPPGGASRGAAPPGFLRRMGPVRLIAAVAVLVAIAVVALIATSGGGGPGRGEVEAQLEAMLADAPYGAEDPVVTCPDGIEVRAGGDVACDAEAADGSSVTVEATIESTDGEVELSIHDLVEVGAIAAECQDELTDLVSGVGIAERCTVVDCPDLVEAMPNGTLECTYTLDTGDEGTIDIPLDEDGTTSTGSWSATET